MSALTQQILAVSVVLAALAGIVKVLHIHEIGRGLLIIVRDWRGDPPRPGYEGRPSFPERMTRVENRTQNLNHDLRGEVMSRLTLLGADLEQVQGQTAQLKRNGGSHLADAVHEVRDTVDRLEQGLGHLVEKVAEVSAKAEAVSDKADRLGERQEVLRSADAAFAEDLRRFIEREHRDLIVGNEGLRAALNEVLAIDEEGRS